jgi:hypothetical protein
MTTKTSSLERKDEMSNWDKLRKKQKEEEKQQEEKLNKQEKCRRCQKTGHTARSCLRPKKPTDTA